MDQRGAGRWPEPALMLVTDRRLVNPETLVGCIEQAVAAGVTAVQLRERDLPAGELLALAREVRRATAGRALLLVNDRVDVALAVGADGVHLGETALPVRVARDLLGPARIVGAAAHGLERARLAQAEGADYVLLGTVFPSASKPGVLGGGPGLVRAVAEAVDIPVIAIGGIGPERVAEVVGAGAAGVAVISAILAAPDPGPAARQLWQELQRAWKARAAQESGESI